MGENAGRRVTPLSTISDSLLDAPAAGVGSGRSDKEIAVSASLRRVAGTIPSRRLDFLRGIAAMYVLLGHARGHLFAGGTYLVETGQLQWWDYAILGLLQLTSMGTEAVIIFFVLSGFAMAHSFSNSESVKSFYAKRLVRIWPPYLAAAGLAFLIAWLLMRLPFANGVVEKIAADDWGFWPAVEMAAYWRVNTVLTAQFWSLPQEVLFYLLAPILLISKSRVTVLFFASVMLTSLSIAVVGIYDDPTISSGVVVRQFAALLIFFMTGAIAYHYQDFIPRMGGKALAVVFVASFVIIWAFKYQIFDGWNLVTNLMTAPLALLLIANVPASLYERKLLNWGHFSYSLYIVHMQLIILISYLIAVIWGIEQPQMTSYWMWMLAVPPIILISYGFYYLTEKRCDAVLRRIRSRERETRFRHLS